MTTPGGDGDRLASLLTRLLGEVEPAVASPECGHETIEPLVHLLVYSYLLWESTPTVSSVAIDRLYGSIVDPNELRVSMPQEIEEWIGVRDPVSLERAQRLRASLNSIYRREHLVTLEALASASKREVREYLDALEGMPSFVAARVTLFGFHGHAIPTDQRLCALLEREDVLAPGLATAEVERWLERQIRASDGEQIVLVLDAWRDSANAQQPTGGRAGKRSRARAAKTGDPSPTPKRSKKGA